MTADERRAGPPTGHADLDTLADLHAGVLDEAETERVRGHVAGCRQCTATLTALDRVQGELRSLPAPALPAAVAARLDATLADLRTAPADRTTPTDGREPSRPAPRGGARSDADELELARMRRGRRLSRALGAVAAAVVLIAAGGAVTAIVRAGTGGDSSGAAGSAASAPMPAESGSLAPRTAHGTPQQDSSGAQPEVPAYNRRTLRAVLPAIAADGLKAVMADPARRTACAGSIPGTTGTLRGVRHIDYEGQRAYVFVFADGGRLTGYVVPETCGNAQGLPTTVIDTVS